jgi:hypothetical protein
MKLAEVKLTRNLTWGNELPEQLIVRDGKLTMIEDGAEARFGLMEGMTVNVVPHVDLVKTVDYAAMWKYGGAA